MATARAIFQAHVDGLLPESIPIDCQWAMPATVGVALMPFPLTTGDNTLTPPIGTTLCILIPPAASAVALKLKGIGADTGWTLKPNVPAILTVGTASVIINAAAPGVTVTLGFL